MAKRQNIVTHRKYCLSQYFKPKLQPTHSATGYFDPIRPSPTNYHLQPTTFSEKPQASYHPTTEHIPLPYPSAFIYHPASTISPPNIHPFTPPTLKISPLSHKNTLPPNPTSAHPPPIPSTHHTPILAKNEKRFIFFLSKPQTEANLRAPHQESSGQVSEWSNEHAWKVCVLATVPRVRIPPCPPLIFRCNIFVMSILRFLFTGVWKKITGRNWTAIMHPCYLMLYSQQFFYEK